MVADPVKWNKRASMLYAVGVWTMLVSYGVYRFRHRNDPPLKLPDCEEDTRPNVKKIQTPHMSTTIVYKEDFVPYSTRLMNLFRSPVESASGNQADEK